MLERDLKQQLIQAAAQYPIIVVEGPTGAGKTHLVQKTLAYEYVDMADIDTRDSARHDPWNFLYNHYDPTGSLIIDEIQKLPQLLPYIQQVVAKKPFPGSFILTSSTRLSDDLFNDQCCRLTLLPPSISECNPKQLQSLDTSLFTGALPATLLGKEAPSNFFGNLIHSFVEKTLPRQLKVADTETFLDFMRQCAGRVGQMINFSTLGDEVGVSHNTARAWIALLEKNHFIHLLQPYSTGFGKRVVKTPKLYFTDTGVASWLLGLRSADQLMTHYLKSKLFESMIITDFIKENAHRNLKRKVYFWRDKLGAEVNCLLEDESGTTPIVIRSGRTVTDHYEEPLKMWQGFTSEKSGFIIYAGEQEQKIGNTPAIPWRVINQPALV